MSNAARSDSDRFVCSGQAAIVLRRFCSREREGASTRMQQLHDAPDRRTAPACRLWCKFAWMVGSTSGALGEMSRVGPVSSACDLSRAAFSTSNTARSGLLVARANSNNALACRARYILPIITHPETAGPSLTHSSGIGFVEKCRSELCEFPAEPKNMTRRLTRSELAIRIRPFQIFR